MIDLPIFHLNECITNVIKKIISLDIKNEISSGLNPEVKYIEDIYNSNSINVSVIKEIPSIINDIKCKRYVSLSMTFSQVLWLICSIALKNHDCIAIESCVMKMNSEEFEKYKKEMEENNCYTNYQKCLFNKPQILQEATSNLILVNNLINGKIDEDVKESLQKLDMTSPIGVKVNSLYVYGISFILLHEFSHHSLGHEILTDGTLKDEVEADNNAFWAMYSDLTESERTTAMHGILCALVTLLFTNTKLEDDGIHPKPIERIFDFYDIMKDESPKFAGILCHLLWAWAVYTNIQDDNFPKNEDSYDNTLIKMRNYLIELENKNNQNQ